MSYKKWYQQYLSQHKLLLYHIKALKKEKESCHSNLEEIKKRITILYVMCLDLKHTGDYLKKCVRREKNYK